MRKLSIAGLTLVLAACGGGGEQQQQAAQPEAPAAAPAPAPAGGASHDVNMVLEGTAYKYVPDQLTIKAGDQVVFHNVSGGPHNVQFWADSIPAGAAEPLAAGMPEQMSPLAGPLVVEPNGTYTVSFANTPAGEYKYYCLPHLANKMVAKITVTQ
jgi:plastocyanin